MAAFPNREQVVETILTRLENGETLAEILRSEGMPAYRTVMDWLKADAELAARYGHSAQLGYDMMAEQALQRAREAKDPALGRLQFDAERWFLGKRAPKKYGDKLELGGPDGGPLQIIINKPSA